MKLYLTLCILFISISAFPYVSRTELDSLKTLVVTSMKGQSKPDSTSIDRLNKLAADFFDTNPDSTIYYAEKSISLARKIKYKAGLAEGLLQSGHAAFFKGKFKDAKQNFNEAIVIYKNLKNQKGLANCYVLYGRLYNLLADYKSALAYLNLALDINTKLAQERALADNYKNLGIVYYSEGQLSKALDYYYQALYLDRKLNNKLAAAANYNDIGVVLQSMEVYPKALEYFNKALTMFKGSKDLQGVGIVYQNIGEINITQKNYDQAINFFNLSITIAKKQDDKDGMSSVYTDLGICYAHKGEFTKATGFLDTSLQIARKYKIVYNEAYALIGYATAYNLQKDFRNAYKYAIKGQKTAVKLGNLSVRSNAALQLNKTLAGLHQYNEAYKMLNQYIALKDSLNNNESIQKLTSYSLEFDFETKTRQLALQEREKDILYQQRIQQQRLIIAFFLSITLGMIAISVVYYIQKRHQQKINLMLEEKNHEVLAQKANLDDQANKLNELNHLKDRLIAILAHDLRAPLSTLRGLFSLLQDESISHQEMLNMIPNILKKLEYTSDFLDTLLFWINSQMENFDSSAKSFYIKDIVSYETENYHEQASLKGIRLIDNVPGDLIASADPNSIRIVVRNLITNAIKFSNHNDTIEITARQQDEKNYVIAVKDTGIGMSEDQLEKIFKSKVTSKSGTNNESGTGMGMLFCKDLVEKCSGKIWVTSEYGRGTEFSFTLPIGVYMENNLVLA